ncbi:homoserine dehydrogenase [Armatimonas rosea]|uniref:Homoserine dehydrogenase n=1 Tax=Armatimonas rosea TaxID=685828 RepID=A0A7W9ST73_ARMRO|nr:homoserine dehydrogenase [Armatimonas rosea]MBB6051848.1 homoserine dehydrogenase [Armatimonas rosea]
MRQIKIGILGLGVVGSGTVRILQENAEAISRRVGAELVVKKIAVRNLAKDRDVAVDPALLTDNPFEVIDDPEIEILAELVGGVDPCHGFLLRAIQSGKNIVTANKELMAKSGHDLLDAAQLAQKDFFLEGSVAGGIPIIAAMKESLAGNNIKEVMGIVNGTTNYILTRMTEEGADFAPTLADAQRLGYAEADPTSDVDGHDAAYKLAILSSLAFNSTVNEEKVPRQGIRHIQARDIAVARDLGYKIKLIASAQCHPDGSMQARVHPALLPNKHPLASVNDVFNAVLVRGDAVGDVMFYGRGAGSLPTGSAVVGDLIACARNIVSNATGRVGCTCYLSRPMLPSEQAQSKFYVRLHALDKPKVLASIANVYGDFDVSIESVVQRALPGDEAEIVWVTHKSREHHLLGALDVISRLPAVSKVHNWIRVEE